MRVALAVLLCLGACAGPRLASVAGELDSLAGDLKARRGFRSEPILADALAKDSYTCLPPVDQVLAPPPAPIAEHVVRGRLPHYDWYRGPMHYRIGSAVLPSGDRVWTVKLNIAVEAHFGGTLELPDCEQRDQLEGPIVCEGTPYEDAPGLEACPDSGRFEAPATRRNLRALLARWSREAEGYWNRDALHYGLPVRYDFELFLADEMPVSPVDLEMELWPSCGRTPYFLALRSGWSLSIVAHELGHFLGLVDEYEALSGITSLYPKTPFAGSESSRMGVSMKRDTRFYPLHHYLVLRRQHCDPPASLDDYHGVLQ